MTCRMTIVRGVSITDSYQRSIAAKRLSRHLSGLRKGSYASFPLTIPLPDTAVYYVIGSRFLVEKVIEILVITAKLQDFPQGDGAYSYVSAIFDNR